MELRSLIDETDEMMKHFVDALDIDGKSYIENHKCPIMYSNLLAPGQFFTAQSRALKARLEKTNFDENTKKKILDSGLILVNKKYKDQKPDADLYVTFLHEKLHANRMILINTDNKETEDIDAIFHDGEKFVKGNNLSEPHYVDPAQDVLLGSIDTSKQAISKYEKLSLEEKDDLTFDNFAHEEKMMQQCAIDEALVETMAITAYKLSSDNSNDVMGVIKEMNEHDLGEDINAITNIITRHNDLELFKWMLFPIEYQNGDIHYDYFANYVDERDKEDVEVLTNAENLGFTDDFFEYNNIDIKKTTK